MWLKVDCHNALHFLHTKLLLASVLVFISMHCVLVLSMVDNLAFVHIVFFNDSHFHLFSLLIPNPHYLSLKLTVRKGQRSLLGVNGSTS